MSTLSNYHLLRCPLDTIGVNAEAEEDSVEGEVNVESGDVSKTDDDEEDESLTEGLTASPNADVTVLFTKPAGNGFGKSEVLREIRN